MMVIMMRRIMWRAAQEGINSIAISTRLSQNIMERNVRMGMMKKKKLMRTTRRKKREGKI